MFCLRNLSYLTIISIFYSPITYSLELVDAADNFDKQPSFISIQNASLSSKKITFSNGESIELKKNTGKLIPCSDIQGLMMFINHQSGILELSSSILCGHYYTVKENAQ